MEQNPQSKNTTILIASLQLALSAAMAYFFHWQIKDLLWSLWLSSLVTGLIYVPLTLGLQLHGIFKKPGTKSFNKVVSVIMCIQIVPFFIAHFSGFHLAHSTFLNAFFPLIDMKGLSLEGIKTIALAVITAYWPFLLIDLGLNWKKIFFPAPAAANKRNSFSSFQSAFAKNDMIDPAVMFTPYAKVVRMHIFIIVFGIYLSVVGSKGDHFVPYVALMLLYFFPWAILFEKKSSVPASGLVSDQLT